MITPLTGAIFFSVRYTVPSAISSTTTCSPGEWVRLLRLPKNYKWDHGNLSKLPPINWTGQGMEQLVIFSLPTNTNPWNIYLPQVEHPTTEWLMNSPSSPPLICLGFFQQSQGKTSADRPPQRPKKPKDNKPKVSRLLTPFYFNRRRQH